jgi:hypothetical protein
MKAQIPSPFTASENWGRYTVGRCHCPFPSHQIWARSPLIGDGRAVPGVFRQGPALGRVLGLAVPQGRVLPVLQALPLVVPQALLAWQAPVWVAPFLAVLLGQAGRRAQSSGLRLAVAAWQGLGLASLVWLLGVLAGVQAQAVWQLARPLGRLQPVEVPGPIQLHSLLGPGPFWGRDNRPHRSQEFLGFRARAKGHFPLAFAPLTVPAFPAAPGFPSLPSGPGGPWGPAFPGGPALPGCPLPPGCPAGPGGPFGPGCPLPV